MATKDSNLEALESGSKTIAELVEKVGKSDSTVRTAVKELVEDGSVSGPVDRQYTLAAQTGEKPRRKNHGYARNTSSAKKADERNSAVINTLENESPQALKDIAENLHITVRAARHATWRLIRAGEVEQVERGLYALTEAA